MKTCLTARHLLCLLVAVSALTGCGTPEVERDPNLPIGDPIQTASGTWSWVDVPNSTCDEGTPTGLVANLNGSKKLVLFFEGGGACWDATTCLQLNTSTHGPITRATFDAGTFNFTSSILDRDVAKNPFKDWNYVYIPYCTGDLHSGNNDTVYTLGSTQRSFHHKGRANVQAFLARIAATVSKPEQVLVTGRSAGGYGATISYALIRAYFPAAKVSLVDDSGPLFKGNATSPALRDAWSTAWKYDAVFDTLDPVAKTDFSAIYTALSRKYPADRLALLSSKQDQVIRTYLGLSATAFESALDDLDATVISPLPLMHSFYIPGFSHTMLGTPAGVKSGNVELLDWLSQMQSGDKAWTSAHP